MPSSMYGAAELAPKYDTHGFPRISPTAFSATIIAVLVVAILIAAYKSFLRIRLLKQVTQDDIWLFVAVAASIASAVFTVVFRNDIYNQVYAGMGLAKYQMPPEQFITYLKIIHTLDVLLWASIFSVKFAYLMFFRPLTRGVQGLTTWWWCTLGLLLPSACVNMFITFYSCSDFTVNWIAVCNGQAIYQRQGDILKITAALDIFTDLLIISIPIILISKVQITLLRKFTIMGILSLSGVMIVLEVIRLVHGGMKYSQTDTVWVVFWCSLEASVAIIMVSLTTFRSIYGLSHPGRGSDDNLKFINITRSQGSSTLRNKSLANEKLSLGGSDRSSPSRMQSVDPLPPIPRNNSDPKDLEASAGITEVPLEAHIPSHGVLKRVSGFDWPWGGKHGNGEK